MVLDNPIVQPMRRSIKPTSLEALLLVGPGDVVVDSMLEEANRITLSRIGL